MNQSGLFFAFVDLKGAGSQLPDIFIVPSGVIFNSFKSYLESKKPTRVRWHPKVGVVEPYKNNWKALENHLRNVNNQMSEGVDE